MGPHTHTQSWWIIFSYAEIWNEWDWMSYSPRMLMFMHVYISETVQIQETSTWRWEVDQSVLMLRAVWWNPSILQRLQYMMLLHVIAIYAILCMCSCIYIYVSVYIYKYTACILYGQVSLWLSQQAKKTESRGWNNQSGWIKDAQRIQLMSPSEYPFHMSFLNFPYNSQTL